MKRMSFLLLVAMVVTMPLVAGEQKEKNKGEVKAAASAMPDEKAMMEAWMKAATPGAHHKALEPFAGTWDVTIKSWMAPDAPAMESTGVAEQRWVLGGRFMEQTFKGTFMEMPFEGMGHVGYDNVDGKYKSTWMDNMGTTIMTADGKSPRPGEFEFHAVMTDPMTNRPVKMKEKITVHGNDRHVMEMWAEGPDGKMFKSMEIEYRRRK